MKESYFSKNNIYYRINEFQSGQPALVFIHGLSGSSSAWLEYEKKFEKKYNILTFDIRGHGKSKKFPHYSDYEIKHFVKDIDDLVSYLNIPRFILISHSFGTLIAAEYIKLFRENVLANIFLSPTFNLEKGFMAKIVRPVLKLSKIFDLFPFNPKPGHRVDYTKFPNTTDWNIKRCYADVSNTTLRVYLHCLRQSLKLEQEFLFQKIKVPTLIIHGIKDTMASVRNSIALSKKIDHSKLILLDNADHIIVLNNFPEVSEAIENFIEETKLGLK